ncbi:hypothetical protein [Piscirickettsia salmonis]|nr:hypothetical protein [Piscirickettsia salmonis]
MLGDFASLDVQNTYRGSDAYVESIIDVDLENYFGTIAASHGVLSTG